MLTQCQVLRIITPRLPHDPHRRAIHFLATCGQKVAFLLADRRKPQGTRTVAHADVSNKPIISCIAVPRQPCAIAVKTQVTLPGIGIPTSYLTGALTCTCATFLRNVSTNAFTSLLYGASFCAANALRNASLSRSPRSFSIAAHW